MQVHSLPSLHRPRGLPRALLLAALWVTLFTALLAGCVTGVAPFDKDGIARISDLSKSSLAVYQLLLDTTPDARASMFGRLGRNWSEVETQVRVHLVFEQSRDRNVGSVEAARELLGFWQDAQRQYCKATSAEGAALPAGAAASAVVAADNNACRGLAAGDKDAIGDFVLKQDRSKLERILGAMVKAEEAKKLAGSTPK